MFTVTRHSAIYKFYQSYHSRLYLFGCLEPESDNYPESTGAFNDTFAFLKATLFNIFITGLVLLILAPILIVVTSPIIAWQLDTLSSALALLVSYLTILFYVVISLAIIFVGIWLDGKPVIKPFLKQHFKKFSNIIKFNPEA
jgi:hypothetical protein